MKKILKKILRIITNKAFIIILLLLSQLILLSYLIYSLGQRILYIYYTFLIISIICAISIFNRKSFNPAYKLSWLIVVLAFIPFGVFFYLFFGRINVSKHSRIYKGEKIINSIEYNNIADKKINLKNKDFVKVSNYVNNTTNMPVFDNTSTKYFKNGEEGFKSMINDLKQAKKFIFLEYFIINYGDMWDKIFNILKEKVIENVDVRIIYDDFGCLNKIKNNFIKTIKKTNIKIVAFNPTLPIISASLNYRDHRKILIIDGNICYTGGVNISDEYINLTHPLGYWKDNVIKIKGEGVFNATFCFISMWAKCTNQLDDYNLYKPTIKEESDGFVQLFGGSPFSEEQVTESTYLELINEANKYVYIATPYLILDNEMVISLTNASRSGIDVRIVVPHIPDKKTIFMVTQSYYDELLKAGVKIYEYTPGFIHSKMIITDDTMGIVGSANFDFRSLYLHYEVSCLIFNASSLKDILNDFQEIFKESKEITQKDVKKRNVFKRMITSILKIFAPMM